MNITFEDLVDFVENHKDQIPNDTPIRLATQPRWPFEYSTNAIHVHNENTHDPIIYLSEGTQLGYLPGEVDTDELHW